MYQSIHAKFGDNFAVAMAHFTNVIVRQVPIQEFSTKKRCLVAEFKHATPFANTNTNNQCICSCCIFVAAVVRVVVKSSTGHCTMVIIFYVGYQR